MIKAVLIDIDNTLLDFMKSAKKSIQLCFEKEGLTFSEHVFSTFYEINEGLWKKIERKELTKEEMYKLRWTTIFNVLGIERDGIEFEKLFRSTLSGIAEPVDNAYELLDHLYGKYPLYAASNSSFEHQKKRLLQSDMMKYFDGVVVSETVGALKPAKEFFDYCLNLAGNPPPNEVVIIGDSLTADIEGGYSYGLKTVWFNPEKLEIPNIPRPDFTVNSLLEIKNIL